MQIQLPKLRKINVNRNKKKIFILTDDIFSPSGVGTMAKELIYETCGEFDWVQLAAALSHPEHGRAVDISEQIEKETGKTDLYVKQYKHNGYFSYDGFFKVLEIEKPDAVMLFTDPRHFMEFWPHEHTIRAEYKIPIIYWSIWDSELIPFWNEPFYKSCDLLMAINKQTDIIHKVITGEQTICTYVPHGINNTKFFKIPDTDLDFAAMRQDFKSRHNVDFVVFWNSRNIRRKQPADVILGFKKFCDELPPDQASKCCLLMKTHILDQNGTDLMAVKKHICPNYKVIFNEEVLPVQVMNYFYNLADVTVSMSSAEGFGLSTAESLMAETMIIAPVHGGLQDQMGIIDGETGQYWIPTNQQPSNSNGTCNIYGKWVLPMIPRARQLQGSIPTPYIFDYVVDAEDLANNLLEVYQKSKEERNVCGLAGRNYMNTFMNQDVMREKFIDSVNEMFSKFQPKSKFTITQITKPAPKTDIGLL
jgi:glycosyltransferase involved in cell wall biosynthesis